MLSAWLLLIAMTASGQEHSMRLVDIVPGQAAAGAGSVGASNRQQRKNLILSRPPANYTGPLALHTLLDKCFSTVVDSYEYEVCPFKNVTQHDVVTQWNPFSGVLGVWSGWRVANLSLVSLLYDDGDSCGSKHRQTEIILECGPKNQTSRVSEPHICEYQVYFQTPLACGDNLKVLPLLNNSDDRSAMTQLEDMLYDEEFTVKGHERRQRVLLERAGVQPVKGSVRTSSPPPTVAAWNPPVYVSCETKLGESEAKLENVTLQLQDAQEQLRLVRLHLNMSARADDDRFSTLLRQHVVPSTVTTITTNATNNTDVTNQGNQTLETRLVQSTPGVLRDNQAAAEAAVRPQELPVEEEVPVAEEDSKANEA